jgi:hypothetical protein
MRQTVSHFEEMEQNHTELGSLFSIGDATPYS